MQTQNTSPMIGKRVSFLYSDLPEQFGTVVHILDRGWHGPVYEMRVVVPPCEHRCAGCDGRSKGCKGGTGSLAVLATEITGIEE